ncbi:MAG: D-hexose-6-phosphate mutarotase [Lysobacter sp.]|nr:D-hexose-6-phosphate mutarotase [Lysobacter sp.]
MTLAPPLQLNVGDDDRIEASPFGAHALSWRCQGRERLYLSPRASFGEGKAIRGGVPVIFPQFGERGGGPRHGFARTSAWEPLDGLGSSAPRLAFRLRDNEHTRLHWPHRFEAELALEPSENRLRIALTVRNLDDAAFEFTAALHTYLRVADIAGTLVHGLEDRPYFDSARDGKHVEATDAPVRFEGEVDRIYPGTRRVLRVTDGEQMLRVESEGFADTVVWNPGAELAAGLADLGPGEHRHFVCVEAARILEPVRLEPGTGWTGAQHLIVGETLR